MEYFGQCIYRQSNNQFHQFFISNEPIHRSRIGIFDGMFLTGVTYIYSLVK